MAYEYLILSGLGPDRPGLVAAVTQFLAERGANVEESRMAVLGGEFGVMILASGAPASLPAVRDDIAMLEADTELAVLFRTTRSPDSHRAAPVTPYLILVQALDHEGIVLAISSALHRIGINIVSLETSAYNAPITGSPLFRLEASVDVPQDVPLARVRSAMEEVARDENLDIEVRAIFA